MDEYRAIIVGDSLFSETLNQMLVDTGKVVIIGTSSTLEEVMPTIENLNPDVVIAAYSSETSQEYLSPFLAKYPDLPIIRADLNQNYLQVITSQRVGARGSDLMAVIATLPKRTQSQEKEKNE